MSKRLRKTVEGLCEVCGKTHVCPNNYTRKTCSKECLKALRARFNERQFSDKWADATCSMCSKVYSRLISRDKWSKHNYSYCSRECKDRASMVSSGVLYPRPSSHGTGYHWKKRIRSECYGCGEKRKFLLFIHHLDGDRSNNSIENLEELCANCHVIRHLKEDGGSLIYSSAVLSTDDIIEMAYAMEK